MAFINKDEVIAAINAEMDTLQTHCLTDITARLKLRAVKNAVEKMESIDIVRCKECIWRDEDNQGEDYCTYVKGLADINGESFCSWGERREP